MQKFTFKCEYLDPYRSNEISFEAVTLSEILEEFEFFLKGSGYSLKGNITIIEEPHE